MSNKNYVLDPKDKWEFENGFYLTSGLNRIGKLLAHYELYQKITGLPGDVLEFGVYKGTSLVRFLSFRNLLETEFSRKVIGFDMFGKFPSDVASEDDKTFIENFESAGGYGISKEDLEKHLTEKGFHNFNLIEGNILDTLPVYLKENSARRVSLLHIDVDVYEPTKFILEMLWDKIVPGGLLILDDYGTVEGETRAVEEFFVDKAVKIEKLSLNYIPSFVVKPQSAIS